MSYKYKGANFEVIDEPLDTPVPAGQFDPYKCGTYAGYRQHQHLGMEACRPCKDAKAKKSAAYYEKVKAGRPVAARSLDDSACGTRTGYFRHRRVGGPTCDACREAQANYMINYRAGKRAV